MERNGKTVAAYTLGCKVNMYDTEAMLELFRKAGYKTVDFEECADVYIINTCTVTNLGDKKSRQIIRRARRTNPEAVIAAAGCYAQVAPEEVAKISGINLILGTSQRKEIVELTEKYIREKTFINRVSDIKDEKEFEEMTISYLNDRRRGFIKIQEGCDRFCTFCIIPYARGRVRSREPQEILKEAEILSRNGYKEIVLAGIHVASYGKDLDKINFMDIIERVHEIDGIERIRTSSIEPLIVDEDFTKRIKNMPKICDHFHLSLQSGSDNTLKRMNRRYTKEIYRNAVIELRKIFPDVALTTDVIVGFPGETDEDFNESYQFIEEIELSQMHVFPYSPKKGTPAATFDNQIEQHVKNERSAKMLALSKELNNKFLNKFIDKPVKVLYEKREGDLYEGHSTNYMPVVTKSQKNLENKILQVSIKEISGGMAISKDIL